jgi:hypothetical protein
MSRTQPLALTQMATKSGSTDIPTHPTSLTSIKHVLKYVHYIRGQRLAV